MKTQAAIVRNKNAVFSIEEVDLRDPLDTEVRVKIEACGICRSDLSALEGKETIQYPAVLGHEACGRVEAVGSAVSKLRQGDAVILSWSPACGQCPGCLRGQVHLCREISMSTGGAGPLSQDGQGIDRFMGLGAFCQHVVVPEAMAVPINSTIAPQHSCLIGCAVSTGFGAAVNSAEICPGETVVVLGCGGVGLSAIQGARVAGASAIIAVDPIAQRRAVASALGASDVLAPDNLVAEIHRRTGGGADCAIECVGNVATMQQCFEMIRPGGRAIVVGLPGYTDRLTIPAIGLLAEKTLTGSIYGSCQPSTDFQKILALSETGQFNFEPLVDKVRPFSEINQGFDDMRQGLLTRVVLAF